MKLFSCHTILVLALCTGVSFQAKAQQADSAEITISVNLQFAGKELKLEHEGFITPTGDSVSISRYACYLSGLTVLYADGHAVSEQDSYHLIDTDNPESLQFKLSQVPAGTITGIQFNIGVDSSKSVSGAFGGDLDPVNGMYWSWNSGYINAKLEGKSTSCNTHHNTFEFHIGGYMPGQATLRSVTLPVSNSQSTSGITLIADVASWFTGIDLHQTNRIVMPGTAAAQMADRYVQQFQIQLP